MPKPQARAKPMMNRAPEPLPIPPRVPRANIRLKDPERVIGPQHIPIRSRPRPGTVQTRTPTTPSPVTSTITSGELQRQQAEIDRELKEYNWGHLRQSVAIGAYTLGSVGFVGGAGAGGIGAIPGGLAGAAAGGAGGFVGYNLKYLAENYLPDRSPLKGVPLLQQMTGRNEDWGTLPSISVPGGGAKVGRQTIPETIGGGRIRTSDIYDLIGFTGAASATSKMASRAAVTASRPTTKVAVRTDSIAVSDARGAQKAAVSIEAATESGSRFGKPRVSQYQGVAVENTLPKGHRKAFDVSTEMKPPATQKGVSALLNKENIGAKGIRTPKKEIIKLSVLEKKQPRMNLITKEIKPVGAPSGRHPNTTVKSAKVEASIAETAYRKPTLFEKVRRPGKRGVKTEADSIISGTPIESTRYHGKAGDWQGYTGRGDKNVFNMKDVPGEIHIDHRSASFLKETSSDILEMIHPSPKRFRSPAKTKTSTKTKKKTGTKTRAKTKSKKKTGSGQSQKQELIARQKAIQDLESSLIPGIGGQAHKSYLKGLFDSATISQSKAAMAGLMDRMQKSQRLQKQAQSILQKPVLKQRPRQTPKPAHRQQQKQVKVSKSIQRQEQNQGLLSVQGQKQRERHDRIFPHDPLISSNSIPVFIPPPTGRGVLPLPPFPGSKKSRRQSKPPKHLEDWLKIHNIITPVEMLGIVLPRKKSK